MTRKDLSTYTQVRLVLMKLGTAGAAASVIRAKYITAFSTTVGSWLQLGTSDVVVAINNTNQIRESAWIDLAAGAKADVYLGIAMQGGDAALDPIVGNVALEFR